MKNITKSALTLFVLCIVISCNKSVTKNSSITASSINSEDGAASRVFNWFGIYSRQGYPNDTVGDNFISNEIATLNNGRFDYYFTSIELNIPHQRHISGDSTRLEVRLRNPADTIGSVSAFDVALWLIGSKDSALVSFNAYYPEYTVLKVGDKEITNSNVLLYLFQDWATLAFEAKNKTISIYKDNTQLLNMNYNGNKIGQLKQIHIDFKGSGQVDWVKMFNSNTGDQLMQEDFNIDHHSNVIWY